MGVPWITDFMDSLGLSGPGSTFLRAWPGSVFFVYKNPILGGGRMSGSAENAREGGVSILHAIRGLTQSHYQNLRRKCPQVTCLKVTMTGGGSGRTEVVQMIPPWTTPFSLPRAEF